MGTRLRFFIILLGALLVAAVWTYPLWRPEPQVILQDTTHFPELSETEQQAFALLPESIQRTYIQMRQENALMAVEMLRARLQAPVTLSEEQRAIPELEGAVLVAEGEFSAVAAMTMTADDEREMPRYSNLYNASGIVRIYQFADNRKLMRFEDFSVVNGPSLRVILSSLPTPLTGSELLADTTRIDIGPLLTNVGSQTYTSIPVEIDVRSYRSVVIYDSSYGVIFGVAQISPR